MYLPFTYKDRKWLVKPDKKVGSCKEGGSNAYHHQFFSLSSLKEGLLNICSPKTFNIGYCVIEEEGEE